MLFSIVLVAMFTGVSSGAVSSEDIAKIQNAAPEKATATPKEPRKLLVFSLCKGYTHSSIPYWDKALEIMGNKTGAYKAEFGWGQDMHVFGCGDSGSIGGNLGQFDAIVLNNCTNLEFTPEQRKGLMKFVKSGKGIFGIHAALDNFYDWPEAARMMGGQFCGDPWSAEGTWKIKIDQPANPLMAAFDGKAFRIRDKILRTAAPFYSRDNQLVLMSLDMSDPTTRNVKDIKLADMDTGISWVKNYGKGRIFYGALGYNPQTTWNPAVLRHYLDGIQFVLGDLPVDATPESNLQTLSSSSWEKQTVLISRQADQTVVRSFQGNKTLFKNADPQLAIEWGMANARTTVVLAGKYVVSDRIDVPRDDVTLIVDQGAELSLSPDESQYTLEIKWRPLDRAGYLIPIIYNHGRDDFRLINFGKVFHHSRQADGQRLGVTTCPVFFDGRSQPTIAGRTGGRGDQTCGIKGGLLLVTGSMVGQNLWLVDSREIRVPIVAADCGGDAVLVIEGCESCDLGMIVNLANEPGGQTGETLDLNGRSWGITMERIIGERSHEIIDYNESHVTVGEVVFVGKPRKFFGHTHGGSGVRFTNKPSFNSASLDMKQQTILADAVGAIIKNEVPKLPDALPRFTVKSTVEVTLKDGSKKEYTKEVEIDLRTAR